jgi:hypothetical protein
VIEVLDAIYAAAADGHVVEVQRHAPTSSV